MFQKLFNKEISLIFDLVIPGYKNIYRTIADEKLIISKVLLNYSDLSPKYKRCSELLKNESEQWLKIAEFNRILLNKGFFIMRGLTIKNPLIGFPWLFLVYHSQYMTSRKYS